MHLLACVPNKLPNDCTRIPYKTVNIWQAYYLPNTETGTDDTLVKLQLKISTEMYQCHVNNAKTSTLTGCSDTLYLYPLGLLRSANQSKKNKIHKRMHTSIPRNARIELVNRNYQL